MSMIEIKSYQVAKAEAMLSSIPNGARKAVVSALNKAIMGVRTDAVKQITETYTIKASTIRDAIMLKKANSSNMVASIYANGSPIPLSKFKVAITKAMAGKARPMLQATVKHGGASTIKHGFLATMANGHTGIFLRAGSSRLPIRQMYSLSIPQMLGNKNVQQYLEYNAHERLDKAIEHEIEWVLKGFGK